MQDVKPGAAETPRISPPDPSSSNPYMRMKDIAQVRRDADAGVKLAIEALKARTETKPKAKVAGFAPAKQSWEMTSAEFVGDTKDPDKIAIRKTAHAQHVKEAAKRGENIPPQVLEQYKNNQWAKDVMPPSSAGLAPLEAKIISDFVKLAKSNSSGNKLFIDYKTISDGERSAIEKSTGIDLAGINTHSIDEAAIRHIHKRHGDVNENNDVMPVTDEDIAYIPEILGSYDNVSFAGKSKRNNLDVIIYKKRRNGSIYLLEEARTRKNKLSVVTLYKKPSSEGLHATDSNESGVAQTSETNLDTRSDNIISPDKAKVKPGSAETPKISAPDPSSSNPYMRMKDIAQVRRDADAGVKLAITDGSSRARGITSSQSRR